MGPNQPSGISDNLVGPVRSSIGRQKRNTKLFDQLDDLKNRVLQVTFDAEEAVRLPTSIDEEPRAYIRNER